MKLSIVTSMYNSTELISDFYEQLYPHVQSITNQYEFIFVDDGSSDSSANAVTQLKAKDQNIKLVQLSRNFGHSAAMLAGLEAASGDYIFTSDIDLEDPPELLVQFWREIEQDPSIDSVYGQLSERQGGFVRKTLSSAFYYCLGFLSEEKIPQQIWSRLMSKKYLNGVLEFGEYHLYLSGLFHIAGFRQKAFPTKRLKTEETTYTVRKRIDLALNAITSFSMRPLVYITLLGFIIALMSMIVGVALIVQYAVSGTSVTGWSSLFISIWFFGGMCMFSIGVVGFYVGKTYIQSKNRPRYIVEKVV